MKKMLLATVLTIASISSALAQASTDHEAHHPQNSTTAPQEATPQAPSGQAQQGQAQPSQAPGGMMNGPMMRDMMQMMQKMHNQMQSPQKP